MSVCYPLQHPQIKGEMAALISNFCERLSFNSIERLFEAFLLWQLSAYSIKCRIAVPSLDQLSIWACVPQSQHLSFWRPFNCKRERDTAFCNFSYFSISSRRGPVEAEIQDPQVCHLAPNAFHILGRWASQAGRRKPRTTKEPSSSGAS